MRVKWELFAFLATITGLVVGTYMSRPEPQKILRGAGISQPFVLPAEPTGSGQFETKVAAAIQHMALEADVTRKIDYQEAELNAPSEATVKLNLKLPEGWDSGEWKKPVLASFPDFFKPRKVEGIFDYSTKLHWDESEEARTMPIEKTIEGAELEFHFKLP